MVKIQNTNLAQFNVCKVDVNLYGCIYQAKIKEIIDPKLFVLLSIISNKPIL